MRWVALGQRHPVCPCDPDDARVRRWLRDQLLIAPAWLIIAVENDTGPGPERMVVVNRDLLDS
jgi:hypothetical protein